MYVSILSSSSLARNTDGKLKTAGKRCWIFYIWTFNSETVRIKKILLVAVDNRNIKGGH